MDPALVIGIDAGGTSTRCAVATTDGTIVTRGQAGGANPRSAGVRPSDPLSGALRQALSDVDCRRVAFGVVGAAGAGAAGWRTAHEATVTAWRAAGLTAPVVTVTDLEVAFSAGTPSASGLLLLAGTGAVAAAFRDNRVVHRCDGYGWLLGDEGSAVWIGLRGLRRVLAALDGRAPATALTATVTGLLAGTASDPPAGGPPASGTGAPPAPGTGGPPASGSGGPPPTSRCSGDPPAADLKGPPPPAAASSDSAPGSACGPPPVPEGSGTAHAQALIAAAYALPPAAWGRLAPLVCDAATAGDPAAAEIVESAVDRLLHALLTAAQRAGCRRPDRPPRRGGPPVVLAGSVLITPGPVAEGVRAGVRKRLGVEPLYARDGAAGATAIALRLLSGRPLPVRTHARLLSATS